MKKHRRGVAAAEFALLLPFLCIFLLGTIDFSRLFYSYITITNCARNGALWATDPYANPSLGTVTATNPQSPYASVTAAALADSNLSPTPTVTGPTSGTDYAGNATRRSHGGLYVHAAHELSRPQQSSHVVHGDDASVADRPLIDGETGIRRAAGQGIEGASPRGGRCGSGKQSDVLRTADR